MTDPRSVIILSLSLLAFGIAFPFVYRFVRLWLVLPIRSHRREGTTRPIWQNTPVESLSPEMREFLGRAVHAFRAEGFEVAANLHQHQPAGLSVFITRLVNHSTGELATVMMTLTKHVRYMTLALTSERAEGSRLNTVAQQSPPVVPSNPSEQTAVFPWVTDPAELCEIHRRRVAACGMSDGPRVIPPPGLEIQHLEKDWDEGIKWLVRCRYRYLDTRTNRYRPTWKGAFLVAWKLRWPIKEWLIQRQESRSRRLWRELGMESWKRPLRADAPVGLADESSAASPGPDERPEGALPYEVKLMPDEIRYEGSGGRLIVRGGTPTAWRMLKRSWLTLALIAFIVLNITLIGLRLWRSYAAVKNLPPAVRAVWFRPEFPLVFIAGCVLLAVWELRRVLRALSWSRGTITLSAGPDGLRFSNAPGAAPTGFIPRDRLQTLIVRAAHVSIGTRTLCLAAVSVASRRSQILLVGGTRAALEEARTALMEAIGIQPAKQSSINGTDMARTSSP